MTHPVTFDTSLTVATEQRGVAFRPTGAAMATDDTDKRSLEDAEGRAYEVLEREFQEVRMQHMLGRGRRCACMAR